MSLKRGLAGLLLAILALWSMPDAQSQATPNREDEVRALIQKFANFRNAQDGAGIASLYSEDGEWINSSSRPAASVKGRTNLAIQWSAVYPGPVDRAVTSIEFASSHIAVVHVATTYPQPRGRHEEVFILVREGERHERGLLSDSDPWRIRLHETLE